MRSVVFGVVVILLLDVPSQAAEPVPLAAGVRGLVTQAIGGVVIDGKLGEWSTAFCTPVHYAHGDDQNRPAQFFYMWDDEAFYLGLRCLDARQANPTPLPTTQDGDAVEFYFDTRDGEAFRSAEWSDGAIHLFFSPFQGTELRPRWVMRQGIATSGVELRGVQVAATQTETTYEVEFKLPWINFPRFKPKLGAVLALDAELCSGDGGNRTDRTFAYGSPLGVQQPASLGTVQLVHDFDPDYFATVGPVAFPLAVDTPAIQPGRALVRAIVAIPPAFRDVTGRVELRVHRPDGSIARTIPARLDRFGPDALEFWRAEARWPIDDFAPGTFNVSALVLARTEKPITLVTPRLVSEAIISGR